MLRGYHSIITSLLYLASYFSFLFFSQGEYNRFLNTFTLFWWSQRTAESAHDCNLGCYFRYFIVFQDENFPQTCLVCEIAVGFLLGRVSF